MFAARLRQIHYRIEKPCGQVIEIPIVLDPQGLRQTAGEAEPSLRDDPDYRHQTCSGCERHYGGCQAEKAITPVVAAVDDLLSTDSIRTEVRQEGRTVSLESPAPRALASLLGLLMASSGCPRLQPFRAMALFHQPFATAEENAVRAAGFWLMRHWARNHAASEPFAELQALWEDLEDVNRHVSTKLLAHSQSDVASNGVAYLDVLAKMGTLGLDTVLDTLRPVLLAGTDPHPSAS